jgi:hypothetical protein
MPSSEGDSEQTEANFKNPREVFSQHRMRNKTLFSVFATELRAERVEDIFEAYFSIFSIFSFSPDFAGAVTASWGRIWRNRRRFLSRTCPYTITSFSFLPGVIIEERITSERTPFFAENRSIFHGKNSKFDGSGGYFWPRRLNRLAKLVEMIYIIYRDDFNVKGLDLHALWLSSCNIFEQICH